MKIYLSKLKTDLRLLALLVVASQVFSSVPLSAATSPYSLEEAKTVKSITGTVQDDNGQPLIGVTIAVQGTDRGTITDIDGNFTLDANPGEVLTLTYVGYATRTVIVGEENSYTILLSPDNTVLDEVVVIGYGTQKKSHLTGSISRVGADDLEQLPVSRVDDALVGRVSGVNIAATEGEAGSAPTIRIRGTGSMVASSDPLIVVDGLIVDNDFLGSLDMNDVESFEVLKDAASSAIYGSRGGNGDSRSSSS